MNNLIKQIVESKFNFNIDIEGNEMQSSLSKSKYNSKSLKEILELYNDVVDLDLPSGTLWCKYNLDVNPNQLSKAEDWYGKYYAWGELEGNNKRNKYGELDFEYDNYKFIKKYDYNHKKYGEISLIKYCNNRKYGFNGFTDKLTKLLLKDDAAYLNKKLYNYKFHIPTDELFEELIKYTNNYWVNNYDPDKLVHNPEDDGGIKWLNGRVFEGNGNAMFIPASGYYNTSNRYNEGGLGHLWSSSLRVDSFKDPCYAYSLWIDSDGARVISEPRWRGHCIRPVINL